MKIIKLLILPAILIVYVLFFMATTIPDKCDADCQALGRLNERLSSGRSSLLLTVGRCSYNRVSDTLCVMISGTLNWNWPGFADTVCQQAADLGLRQQKIYILTFSSTGQYDTLAVRNCP